MTTAPLRGLSFVVPGKPVPKARPRFDRRTGHVYTPAKSRAYESRVAGEAWHAIRWDRDPSGVLRRRPEPWPAREDCAREKAKLRRRRGVRCACAWCSAEFALSLVICLPDRRTRDLDNVEKAILDGLTGVLWYDDRQAFVERKEKRLSPERPRVEVVVRVIEQQAELDLSDERREETETLGLDATSPSAVAAAFSAAIISRLDSRAILGTAGGVRATEGGRVGRVPPPSRDVDRLDEPDQERDRDRSSSR